ncbi:MAG: DUF4249 domain-containing protein [Bacteroidales bacterium]
MHNPLSILIKAAVILLPFLLLVLFSCEEKIELELDDSYERLVVEGTVTDRDTNHRIKLSKTAPYYTANQTPRVSAAIVSISDGNNTYTFSEADPGIYESDISFAGVHGKTYTLTIDLDEPVNGVSVYTATDSMPEKLLLDSIRAEPLPSPFNQKDVQVKIWGQEPSDPGNCYIWDLYVNGEPLTDTLNQKSYTDDELVNGSYIPGLPVFFYDGQDNDEITVVTHSITRDYFEFIAAFRQEASSGGGQFSGPPANVRGNISNGGLGFFSAMALSRNHTVYQKP